MLRIPISEMTYRLFLFVGSLATILLIMSIGVPAHGQSQRPLTVDDIFKLEEIGSTTFSRDGEFLAFVLKRPRKQAIHFKRDYLDGNDRGDIWVISTRGGRPRNVTNGATDGAGFWAPSWSPDGRRLAMLSTRGGNVRLWIWERGSTKLRRVTAETVDNELREDVPIWVSTHEMFVAVLPQGQALSRMTLETRAAEQAMRDWPRAWKGKLTVNAIETGKESGEAGEQGKLLLVNVDSSTSRLVMSGCFRRMQLSPDGRFVTFLRRAEKMIPDSGPLPAWHLISEPYHYRAEIATTSGEIVSDAVARIYDVFPGSLTWAPSGATLALVGHASEREEPANVFVFDPASRSLKKLTTTGLDLPSPWRTGSGLPLRVSGSGDVLVLARPTQDTATELSRARRDWWKLDPAKAPMNLTRDMAAVPSSLIAERGVNAFVGVAGGDLVRINVTDRTIQNLTEAFEPAISSIVWPVRAQPGGVDHVIIRVVREATSDFYQVELKSRQLRLIAKPSLNATLADFVPGSQLVLFTANDRSGTYVWLSDLALAHTTSVLETNIFLRGIAQGDFKKIEYRSLDNQPLSAWIILPIGYEQGRRYPMITSVYPGQINGRQPDSFSFINISHPLNLQLLASHGYAVLIPSMPEGAMGSVGDPMAELPIGVLPAVDKAIEIGIADPARLGLMGQSKGGYATLGLVTQTNRFKAAVALAGLSDLISFYGQFDPRIRYDEDAHEKMFEAPFSESGDGRMGAPPWKDLDRYIRNSPLFFVNRVETPVMIVKGDMDYVPLQQGEEFFTGLSRQNKRAAFVRYIGEGHVLQSPANTRDMWQRVFAWFDEFFKESKERR